MTGFTRAAGQHDAFAWTWEIRSVNGRGLDVRLRLPAGFESLEPGVRDAVGKVLKRGSISISLLLNRAGAEGMYRINRDLLDRLIGLAVELRDDDRLSGDAPDLGELLSVRGVVEPAEEIVDPEDAREEHKAMARSLGEALEALVGVRQTEGARLASILRDRLDELDTLCNEADAAAAARTETVRERLQAGVAELLAMSPALPEERLAQECALLAVKADVREELDRLKAHVDGARALLDEGGAIGRRLDFLCQEFNREANTLCAKAGDIALTQIGLRLKAVIDQFREQALNVE